MGVMAFLILLVLIRQFFLPISREFIPFLEKKSQRKDLIKCGRKSIVLIGILSLIPLLNFTLKLEMIGKKLMLHRLSTPLIIGISLLKPGKMCRKSCLITLPLCLN